MKTRIGLIFGGRSGEHEISIRSAVSVIKAIDRDRYSIVPIAIDRTGHWLSPADSSKLLPADIADLIDVNDNEGGYGLLADTAFNGLTSLVDGHSNIGLDVVFPLLHGPMGEDGTIQGLLEMANIPYVGCGVLASSCGMDKVTMKTLLRMPDCPYADSSGFLERIGKQTLKD